MVDERSPRFLLNLGRMEKKAAEVVFCVCMSCPEKESISSFISCFIALVDARNILTSRLFHHGEVLSLERAACRICLHLDVEFSPFPSPLFVVRTLAHCTWSPSSGPGPSSSCHHARLCLKTPLAFLKRLLSLSWCAIYLSRIR